MSTLDYTVRVLSRLYPDREDPVRVLEGVGLRRQDIALSDKAITLWFNVVTAAIQRGKVPALLDSALRDWPEDADLPKLRALWAPATTGQGEVIENPYRGLSAFQETDQRFFFGREELTQRLWQTFAKLHQQEGALRLLTVHGPSGSGKSSVARAGLVPALRTRPVRGTAPPHVIGFRPGERPVEALARALQGLLPERPPEERVTQLRGLLAALRERGEGGAADGLRLLSREALGEGALVVLVDQCEEVYTLCEDEAEREHFIGLLLHAAAARDGQVSVVLTLRSDFIGETCRHPALNQAIARCQVLVPMMSADELRRTIAAPAEALGRPLDPGIVELLLRETEGRPGALPLLEFALTRIWEGMRQGQDPAQVLQGIGGVGGALAGEAQRIYDGLGEAERRIARRAFLGMVQLGDGAKDTRRRAAVAALSAAGEAPGQVQEVLRRFAQPGARLVVLSAGEHGQGWAEMTHEALLEHWRQLQGWLDEGRADLRFHRRLAEDVRRWQEHGRLEVHLYRPPDLDLLRAFATRAGDLMSADDAAFLSASERREQAEKDAATRQRRSEERRAWATIGVTSLIAIVIAGFWLRAQHRLADSYTELGRQELSAGHPSRAAAYLAEAYTMPGGNMEDGGRRLLAQVIRALTPGPGDRVTTAVDRLEDRPQAEIEKWARCYVPFTVENGALVPRQADPAPCGGTRSP